VKERLMICNEEDTDGRASVTRNEERVLPVEWTEIRLCNSWSCLIWSNLKTRLFILVWLTNCRLFTYLFLDSSGRDIGRRRTRRWHDVRWTYADSAPNAIQPSYSQT